MPALGTVQLGLPYGAANTSGMPSAEEATAIILYALEHGFLHLDTAHGYALSQERLGAALGAAALAGLPAPTVVTKLDTTIATAASAAEVAVIVDKSVANSCAVLKLRPLHVVCLHVWANHGPALHGGAAWERLKHHKAQGAIARIGTSTYTPEEVKEALQDPECGHIQLPFNLIDWRWREAGIAEAFAARPDVTVHARSCFLQGILASDTSECWPAKFGREIADEYLAKMEELIASCGRKNRADLCLAYTRAQPWVTEALVGAETMDQLVELAQLWDKPPLSSEQVALVDSTLPRAPADLLNPGKWLDPKDNNFSGAFNKGQLGPR